MKEFKFYEVIWVDAQSDCTWENIDDVQQWLDKDYVVYERGWLVAENDKYIIISNQLSNENDFGNRTKIPKKWIVSKKVLNMSTKKK